MDDASLELYFEPYEERRIDPPAKARIKTEYLEYHREHVFVH